MANKAYLEYQVWAKNFYVAKNGTVTSYDPYIKNTRVFEVPLTADITIEAQSEWSKMADFVPNFLGKVLKLMTTVSAAGGGITSNLVNLNSKLDLPFWAGSPPIRINVQLGFFTKTDAYLDVFDPVKEIVGLSIISKDPDDSSRYLTPGINLKNFNEIGKDKISKTKLGKIISFEIPGIIYLPYAIVESARPTFSNEITESSYPLWATVDLNIMGAGPGSTDAFEEAIDSPKVTWNKYDFSFAKGKAGVS